MLGGRVEDEMEHARRQRRPQLEEGVGHLLAREGGRYLDDRVAEGVEERGGLLDRLLALPVGRLPAEVDARDSDPESGRIPAGRVQEGAGRWGSETGFPRGGACDGVEERRRVAHGPAETTLDGEVVRRRRGTARHPAAARLEPEHAAGRGRDSDRPPTVTALREGNVAGGDGRGGAP